MLSSTQRERTPFPASHPGIPFELYLKHPKRCCAVALCCNVACMLQSMAKGTVEGGYVDNKRLRIKVWKERKDLEVQAEKLWAQVLNVQSELGATEKEIKKAVDRMTQTDRAKKSALNEEADMQQRVSDLKRKVRPLLPRLFLTLSSLPVAVLSIVET